MLEKAEIADVLFLDIETVSGKKEYGQLDDNFKALWAIKARQVLRTKEEIDEDALAATYEDRAGIFAEFGKIVCISVGIVHRDKEDQLLKLRLKSFASENEAALLHDFSKLLFEYYNDPNKKYICGHNIKEFDIPYICRRMLVNQLPFPNTLNIAGTCPVGEVKRSPTGFNGGAMPCRRSKTKPYRVQWWGLPCRRSETKPYRHLTIYINYFLRS
jgi:DNA polymerase elongation subunit (family B)